VQNTGIMWSIKAYGASAGTRPNCQWALTNGQTGRIARVGLEQPDVAEDLQLPPRRSRCIADDAGFVDVFAGETDVGGGSFPGLLHRNPGAFVQSVAA